MPVIEAHNTSSRVQRWICVLCIGLYLVQGIRTELQFMERKPLSFTVLEDYRFYERALVDTNRGIDPYALRSIGPGFLYPPQSLLLIEVFHNIVPFDAKYAAYLILTIALMLWIVSGIAAQYGYSLQHMWYWYVLCLGFAPFLELLQIGQINVITLFGIFLLIAGGAASPMLGGLGLSLAILTKVSPVVLLAYLAATRRMKTIVSTVAWILALTALTILRYGVSPLLEYPETLRWLADQFPIGPNSQSLISKIITVVGLELSPSQIHLFQTILMFYTVFIVLVSAIVMLKGNQPSEPLFLITAFAVTVMPNVMWYHHYVFLLLPILIWMAWVRLEPRVVLWCLLGMLIIQSDRFSLTDGLLIHGFVHISIVAILVWQTRQLLLSKRSETQIPVGGKQSMQGTIQG